MNQSNNNNQFNTQSSIPSSYIPSSSSSSSSSGSSGGSQINHPSQFTQAILPSQLAPNSAQQQQRAPTRQIQKKITPKKDQPIERAEFIRFTTPSAKSTLFISNLPETVTNDEMREILTPYGLIYDIVSISGNFLVKFYSVIAAQRVYNELYGKLVHEYPMRITFSKSQNSGYDLKYEQSIELINYYIGFNQWSSEILETKLVKCDQSSLYTPEELEALGGTVDFAVVYEHIATVKMTLKDQRSLIAHGISSVDSPISSVDINNHPRKAAISNARKAAFSKLAIVIVDGQTLLHIIDQPIDDQWNSMNQHLSQKQQPKQCTNQELLNNMLNL